MDSPQARRPPSAKTVRLHFMAALTELCCHILRLVISWSPFAELCRIFSGWSGPLKAQMAEALSRPTTGTEIALTIKTLDARQYELKALPDVRECGRPSLLHPSSHLALSDNGYRLCAPALPLHDWLRVNRTPHVATLKHELSQQTNTPVDSQRLLSKGHEMHDDKPLSYYCQDHKQILYMVVRFPGPNHGHEAVVRRVWILPSTKDVLVLFLAERGPEETV